VDLTKIGMSFLAALLLTWTSLLTRVAAQGIEQALLRQRRTANSIKLVR
jgi:hypothetical protein